jgi:hypothetical protein
MLPLASRRLIPAVPVLVHHRIFTRHFNCQ